MNQTVDASSRSPDLPLTGLRVLDFSQFLAGPSCALRMADLGADVMRDSLAEYQSLDAEILAISVDSPFTLAKWKEEQGFNFPLLSDFNKTVSKKYDALYKEFGFGLKGVSKRAAFVIDGQGTIRYAEVLENAGEIPDFAAVKKALNA